MSNIVTLSFPARARTNEDRIAVLAQSFAHHRRDEDDVFWLKENAEFLNVLESSGLRSSDAGLASYAAFYDRLPDRFAFFPQYYRFLLSMCLDLEDLGLPGDTGTALVARACAAQLPAQELSDLQRAEARRLMARRGYEALPGDPGLTDRLRAFAAQAAGFALPNKKAAYELTHIVFYLSEYGRRNPDLPPEAEHSLIHIGLLALLEGNTDLLAEACIALRFGGFAVPPQWDAQVRTTLARFLVDVGDGPLADDYHAWLMAHWHGFLTGKPGFSGDLGPGRITVFAPPPAGPNALRDLSECLYGMERRHPDWDRMRHQVRRDVAPATWDTLCQAEASTPGFVRFFETFARATSRAPHPVAV